MDTIPHTLKCGASKKKQMFQLKATSFNYVPFKEFVSIFNP